MMVGRLELVIVTFVFTTSPAEPVGMSGADT
jgi:hypothetical protein